MEKNKTYNRKKILFASVCIITIAIFLVGRLTYLMIFRSDYYQQKADALHERERSIKAARGIIYDKNGVALATNKPVCTISVIHNQITNPEEVIKILSKELSLSEDAVRKRVEKKTSIERVKTNVDKSVADTIREYDLNGVMVDEDYKRYYPFESLASKVIGFTGKDNQGIIGLEVKYDKYLQGINGTILTLTDARGVEIENAAESRVEPIDGNSLYISLDVNIQKYVEQAAKKVLEAKNAKSVSVIIMNPQNGEIYSMVNVPEFDLNTPYELTDEILAKAEGEITSEKQQELLNGMWRNQIISDTYEPGSTFKIITATAALEEKVVSLNETFSCPGFRIVEDRRIKCHKVSGHGTETFIQGVYNSCNPVFMDIGARVGITNLYKYFEGLGLFKKTGIDLPGEASSIMHKIDKVGAVELATITFGQSFQITPLQLMTAVSDIINGGHTIVPHFGLEVKNSLGDTIEKFEYPQEKSMISNDTAEKMKTLLEGVVSEGTGSRAYIPGLRIGGKTATSEKFPRSLNKYISSFIGFAPANDPKVLALVLIDEPTGIYYGGTIAAPIIGEIFDNILPYLGVEPSYTEEELKKYNVGEITTPNFLGKTKKEVKELLKIYEFGEIDYLGEGDVVVEQFPLEGDKVNKKSDLILYLE